MQEKIRAYFVEERPATPVLVLDLDVVATRYDKLLSALPDAEIFYAVKANPAPEILKLLAARGARFDVASVGEIDMCLAAGADPVSISYGNPIKKRVDIAYAARHGVRLFAFDSEVELDKLAEAAPGAEVFCRILTSNEGADWPLSRKFGCDLDMAVDLLAMAQKLQLNPVGVSFHVGSQQRNPSQWDAPLAQVAWMFDELAEKGIELSLINLGGGFPAIYRSSVPPISVYGDAIRKSIQRHFTSRGRTPRLIERRVDAVGDERERGAALAHERLARMMSQHEHRMVVRRVWSPPSIPRRHGVPRAGMPAEHVPPHDRGAEVGDRLLDHLRALVDLPALAAVHLPEDRERKHPFMHPHAADAERIVDALIRSGDEAVERHRDLEAQPGHATTS